MKVTNEILYPNIKEEIQELQVFVRNLGSENKQLKSSVQNLQRSVESLSDENQNLATNFQNTRTNFQNQIDNLTNHFQKGLIGDLRRFMQNENIKDFTIIIDEKEYLVHKFLLAARSPTLAETFSNNPGVDSLNLVDISVEIFEIILKFPSTHPH